MILVTLRISATVSHTCRYSEDYPIVVTVQNRLMLPYYEIRKLLEFELGRICFVASLTRLGKCAMHDNTTRNIQIDSYTYDVIQMGVNWRIVLSWILEKQLKCHVPVRNTSILCLIIRKSSRFVHGTPIQAKLFCWILTIPIVLLLLIKSQVFSAVQLW